MASESYEPIKTVEAPKRERRPWWRWNLIVLAVALFVLLWTREILNIPPSQTWLMAGSLFFLWAVMPAPFVDWSLTTIKAPTRRQSARRRTILVGCRVLALLVSIVAILHAGTSVYWTMEQYSRNIFSGGRLNAVAMMAWQIAMNLALAFSQFAIAAILWLLAEAVEKLDRLPSGDEMTS